MFLAQHKLIRRIQRKCDGRVRGCNSCVNVRTCLCHKINIYSNDACKQIFLVSFRIRFRRSYIPAAFSIITHSNCHCRILSLCVSRPHWFTSLSSVEFVFAVVIVAATKAREPNSKVEMCILRFLDLDTTSLLHHSHWLADCLPFVNFVNLFVLAETLSESLALLRSFRFYFSSSKFTNSSTEQ